MPLILELDGHPVLAKSPQGFLELIAEFPFPFPPQELPDLLPTFQEFRAIAPLAILRMSQHETFWVARVPEVFGELHFCAGGLSINGGTMTDVMVVSPSRIVPRKAFTPTGSARFWGSRPRRRWYC